MFGPKTTGARGGVIVPKTTEPSGTTNLSPSKLIVGPVAFGSGPLDAAAADIVFGGLPVYFAGTAFGGRSSGLIVDPPGRSGGDEGEDSSSPGSGISGAGSCAPHPKRPCWPVRASRMPLWFEALMATASLEVDLELVGCIGSEEKRLCAKLAGFEHSFATPTAENCRQPHALIAVNGLATADTIRAVTRGTRGRSLGVLSNGA